MSEDEKITPGERRELRSVVKQQFKVLRTEVEERKVELAAECDRRIAERYRVQDELREQLNTRLRDLWDEFHRSIRMEVDAVNSTHGMKFDVKADRYSGRVSVVHEDMRHEEKKALSSSIMEQVRLAGIALDRQEADLLKNLAIDAIESSAARSFIAQIPTAAELIPNRRIRELEMQLGHVAELES